MSVLIRGMEMPKNCSDCNFCYDMFMCCMSDGPEMDYEKMDMERHPDCPLIEIPPRGRLIDADALVNDCEKYIKTLNPDRDGKEIAKIRWLADVLNGQPPIIEAEGDAE